MVASQFRAGPRRHGSHLQRQAGGRHRGARWEARGGCREEQQAPVWRSEGGPGSPCSDAGPGELGGQGLWPAAHSMQVASSVYAVAEENSSTDPPPH